MHGTVSIHEYEKDLVEFLEHKCSLQQDKNLHTTTEWPPPRTLCSSCGAELCRIYCSTCLEIQIPKDSWPRPLVRDLERGTPFRLPFKVDLILDDKRGASTGIQAAAICQIADSDGYNDSNHEIGTKEHSFRIFERDSDEKFSIPNLSQKDEHAFVLFPGPGSRPLSEILSKSTIDRLVVLDCKWTKSSVRLNPHIDRLPKVSLDIQPSQSYFWRWHAAGEGMVSTIEAIYYAARQVADALEEEWNSQEKNDLVHLLWLFGLQRDLIRQKYEAGEIRTRDERAVPFSPDAKEFQRKVRDRGTKRSD